MASTSTTLSAVGRLSPEHLNHRYNCLPDPVKTVDSIVFGVVGPSQASVTLSLSFLFFTFDVGVTVSRTLF